MITSRHVPLCSCVDPTQHISGVNPSYDFISLVANVYLFHVSTQLKTFFQEVIFSLFQLPVTASSSGSQNPTTAHGLLNSVLYNDLFSTLLSCQVQTFGSFSGVLLSLFVSLLLFSPLRQPFSKSCEDSTSLSSDVDVLCSFPSLFQHCPCCYSLHSCFRFSHCQQSSISRTKI